MATQYILAAIAAAGLGLWYDFKSWQSSGVHLKSLAHRHLLTRLRNRRHTINSARLPKDPALGSLSTVQATEPA